MYFNLHQKPSANMCYRRLELHFHGQNRHDKIFVVYGEGASSLRTTYNLKQY